MPELCEDHARTIRNLSDPRRCHHLSPADVKRLAADLGRQCRACLGIPTPIGLGRERA